MKLREKTQRVTCFTLVLARLDTFLRPSEIFRLLHLLWIFLRSWRGLWYSRRACSTLADAHFRAWPCWGKHIALNPARTSMVSFAQVSGTSVSLCHLFYTPSHIS